MDRCMHLQMGECVSGWIREGGLDIPGVLFAIALILCASVFTQIIGIVPPTISVEWPHLFSTNFLNIFSVISLDVQGLFVLDCYVEA